MFVIWVLPYGLAAFYDFLLGQEFLPNSYPTLSNVIPSWVPLFWFIIGCVAIIVVTFEGTYRITRNSASQSQTLSTAVQPYTLAKEYPPRIRRALSKLIQQGEELCNKMQVREFSVWHLEPVVREWLDESSQKVYKILPELASYILADQGAFTEGEKSQYQGWKWDNFSLRINIDRRLARLREIESKIRVPDKEGSTTPNAPKLPSPELRIYYLKHEFGVAGEGKFTGLSVDNGTPILSIEAEFSPTGPMKIDVVKLHLVGEELKSLNWKVQEYSDLSWGSPSNAFDVSGISPGKHDTELWARASGDWWGPYPFSIDFLEVNS